VASCPHPQTLVRLISVIRLERRAGTHFAKLFSVAVRRELRLGQKGRRLQRSLSASRAQSNGSMVNWKGRGRSRSWFCLIPWTKRENLCQVRRFASRTSGVQPGSVLQGQKLLVKLMVAQLPRKLAARYETRSVHKKKQL
jgi:hypothetical protein